MSQLFTFDSANLISSSTLNIHNDNCPICRNQLTEPCLDCNSNGVEDNHDSICKSVLGICNHGYHLHCIQTWLKNKIVCPLDNQKWCYQKHENTYCKNKFYKKDINNSVLST